MAPDTSWGVRVDAAPGRYYRPMVELSGPGPADLVRHVAELLADSIHDGDGRAQAWSDYLIAVARLRDADDASTPDREADVADAWEALEPELPAAIRMPLVQARIVGQQLDRTATGAMREIGRAAA